LITKMVDLIKVVRVLVNQPMPWGDRQETIADAPRPMLARIAVTLLEPLGRWTPQPIKTMASDFVRDKSQSELVFLACALLSVFLFAVVLPLCDALLDEREEDQLSRLRDECDSRLKMYKSGVGVVEVKAQDVARQTLSGRCSSSTRSQMRRSSSTLRGTVTFLEKIEESDEEYREVEEEDEDESSDSSVQSTETPTSSPPTTPDQERPTMTSSDIDELRMKLSQHQGDESYHLSRR